MAFERPEGLNLSMDPHELDRLDQEHAVRGCRAIVCGLVGSVILWLVLYFLFW